MDNSRKSDFKRIMEMMLMAHLNVRTFAEISGKTSEIDFHEIFI